MKDYHEMAEDLFQRRDRYLAERKKKMNLLIKTISGICCFFLAALSGTWILNTSTPSGPEPYTKINPVPLEITAPEPQTDSSDGNNANRLESLKESINDSVDTDSKIPENSPNKATSDNAALDNTASGNTASGNADAPVSEQSPGSLQAVTVSGNSSDFFGGSYTNSQGRLCILLTKNTPENRAAICRELGIDENSAVFQNASYTLSYLTELQARISEGMISRELNFVIISSLREDTNRIHLTVTTKEESLLEKLKSLDSLGGALEIEYSPDSMTPKHMRAVPE